MSLHPISLPDGGQISAQLDGPDGAPVVALANSVLTDFRIWDAQSPTLLPLFRVLRFDQRGHGGSSLPTAPMRFDDYGADVLRVLDAFDVQSCAFVGLSMGVPTGLAAFAQAPERFAAFVAVDGVSKSAPGREAFWLERRETALRDGMDQIAATTLPRWVPGDETSPKAEALREMIALTPAQGFAAATKALSSYDTSAALEQMCCPFLGIAGSLDGAMPSAMRDQFDCLPQASFTDIDGAGHLPNFQRPGAFNAALLTFLTTHYAPQEIA